jgi:signal transduction histidine kinase
MTLLPSLKTRLVVIVLLALLPAFVLMYLAAQDERQYVAEQTEIALTATSDLVASNLAEIVKSAEEKLRWLALLPEMTNSDAGVCTARLNALFQQVDGYLAFSVAHSNGDVYCLAPARVLTSTLNIANRPFFQPTLQKKGFVIGGFQTGSLTSKAALTFGYPILDVAGNVQAVIGAGVEVQFLNQAIASWHLPPNTAIVLTDQGGTIVARFPDSERWVGKEMQNAPLMKRLLQNQKGQEEIPGLDGVRRLYAFTSFQTPSNTTLFMAIGYEPSVILAESNRRLQRNLIGLGVIGIVALAVAWFSTEWLIVRRTRAIINAAALLRTGDLTVRTEAPHDGSELGQLAKTFDEMLNTLQYREEALKKLNTELEHRVDTRTVQLKSSNIKLLASQAELRQLSQQLMVVVEEERTRLSREVHDQLGQALTAIKMDMVRIKKQLGDNQPELAVNRLTTALELVDETIQLSRRIASELRPTLLDNFGLVAAIEWQLQEFEKRCNIACTLTAQIDEQVDDKVANADLTTTAYRILQEVLTNVARHAQASAVQVQLTTDEKHFIMQIQDNGRGFVEAEQRAKKSLGLLGMRERAGRVGGQVKIESTGNQGTTVTVLLPFIYTLLEELPGEKNL